MAKTPKYRLDEPGLLLPGTAAGDEDEIQFNTGDVLDADSDLQWDSLYNELKLNDLTIQAMNGSITVNDGQTSPGNIVNLIAASVKFAVIEYSIERNNETRIGQLFVAHNGTTSSLTDVSSNTGGAGIGDADIVFSSLLSGGSLFVQYTSNATGFSGSFKYSIRKWN